MGRKPAFVFILLLSGLAGCVSPTLIRLGHPDYPPKPADCDIKVFEGDAAIPRSYMEVCIFSYGGSTEHPFHAAEDTVDSCKPLACKAGCDAIVIEKADAEGVNLNPGGLRQGKLSVIKGIRFMDSSDISKKMAPEQILYLHVK